MAFASRRPGEPWFCFEQPDRERHARWRRIGAAAVLEDRGPEPLPRGSPRAGARWPPGPWPTRRTAGRGSGLVACGGFAFAPDGGASPQWRTSPRRRWSCPRWRWPARRTTCGSRWPPLVARRRRPGERVAGRGRATSGRAPRGPRSRCSIPHPWGGIGWPGRWRPSTTSRRSAVRSSGSGPASSRRSCSPARSTSTRRAPTTSPPCSAFCARRSAPASSSAPGRGDAAFIAASPELLIRREGMRGEHARPGRFDAAQRRPGGRRPPRRAAAPLGQGPRGARRSSRGGSSAALRPALGLGDQGRPSPCVVTIANIQHLATPVRAQLRRPVGAVELAGLLHPTPAVGGEPHAVAARLIPALEGIDRGWYAGPVGWTDANEDGEFCVALRCALRRGPAGPLLRRRRRGRRLRPGRRAGRDRDQAPGPAARPLRLSCRRRRRRRASRCDDRPPAS